MVSALDRAGQAQAQLTGSLGCVPEQDAFLSQCLSWQVCKWVAVNCWGNLTEY